MNPPERLPPQNLDAERSVLGSMIRENRCIGDVVALVKADDFYADAHQRIFKLIVELWDKAKPIDLVTLADRLVKTGQLDDIGGYPAIADLFDCAPTSANAEYYARAVRDRSLQRKLLRAGQEIVCDASNPTGEIEEMLGNAEAKILDVADQGVEGQAVPLSEALDLAMNRIDDRHGTNKPRGVLTGYIDLDEITCGLQDGELIVIAARPSVGKTSFGLNVAHHAAINLGTPTLFVSLEQSKTELAERLLCLHSGVDGHKVRKDRMNADDMQHMCNANDVMRKSGLYIDDTSGLNMLRIAATARRLRARKGIKLVLVDYLQLIDPDDKRAPRQEQVSNISRRLKHLARELKIPVVAMAQLNRLSEGRTDKRPKLSDLRESGAIEQDADVVMLLHRPEEEDPASSHVHTIEVDVAKQRNGPTDRILLLFRKSIMRFENYQSGESYGRSA